VNTRDSLWIKRFAIATFILTVVLAFLTAVLAFTAWHDYIIRTAPPRSSVKPMSRSMHAYEIRPRKDKRGFDLISDAPPFGAVWYTKPNDAIECAKFYSRSHDAVIRVYDRKKLTVDQTFVIL
jgi:hypothetical protein